MYSHVKLFVGLIALAVTFRSLQAESERPLKFDPNSLDALLPRIHDHVVSDDWKKEDFSDKALEAWFDKLFAGLVTATGDKDLALPVRFADVRPTGFRPVAAADRPQKVLIFSKGGEEFVHVENSIIFSDGSVKVSFAHNSVIVSRGAVYVAHAHECVIISGNYVHVSHCDNGRAGAAAGGMAPKRSVILSRGMADLSFATSCVLFAPLGIDVSHADGCFFINHAAPDRRGPAGRQPNVRVDMTVPPLETISLHALGKQVEFLSVLDSDRGAVIRLDGKRYITEQNAEIVDESGKAVEKLAGWKQALVNSQVLVLSRENVDTAIIKRQKR